MADRKFADGSWHKWRPKRAVTMGPIPFRYNAQRDDWEDTPGSFIGTIPADMEYNYEYEGPCENPYASSGA